MYITDQEEYRDWAANETFAEVRRQVFITSPATKTAMEKMTEFALTALDEPSFEPEAELSKLRTHTLTKMLKKKYDYFCTSLVFICNKGIIFFLKNFRNWRINGSF